MGPVSACRRPILTHATAMEIFKIMPVLKGMRKETIKNTFVGEAGGGRGGKGKIRGVSRVYAINLGIVIGMIMEYGAGCPYEEWLQVPSALYKQGRGLRR